MLRVTVLESTDSSNNVIKRLADNGEPEGRLVIARSQTAGRGSRGRSFCSPRGTGLYMSLLLRPRENADALLITAAAAVAAASAVTKLTGRKVSVKWVNDIMRDGKKLCGILAESSYTDRLEYVAVGIGINITPPDGGFPSELANIAGAIFEDRDEAELLGVLTDEARAVAEAIAGNTSPSQLDIIAGALAEYSCRSILDTVSHLPDRSFVDEYRHLLLTGHTVRFNAGKDTVQGIAAGVDDECRLLVRTSDGLLHRLNGTSEIIV